MSLVVARRVREVERDAPLQLGHRGVEGGLRPGARGGGEGEEALVARGGVLPRLWGGLDVRNPGAVEE